MKLTLKIIGVVILIIVAFRVLSHFTIESYFVESEAMLPTFRPGETVYISHLNHKTIERGELVFFRHHHDSMDEDPVLIKRVIGIGGDLVRISGHEISVNGKPIKQTRLSNEEAVLGSIPKESSTMTMLTGLSKSDFAVFEESHGGRKYLVLECLKTTGSDTKEIWVPQDEIFIIGDNRDNSNDSRLFGPIPMSEIYGRTLVLAK